VTMFMRYVHSEDDPIRAAADVVALRRKSVIAEWPACTGGQSDACGGASPTSADSGSRMSVFKHLGFPVGTTFGGS